MTPPTPEQVEANMTEKMGSLPESLASAKAIDPRFLVEHAMSSRFSTMDENNPFDKKTSLLITLATSIAIGSDECAAKQTILLKKNGITQDELAYLVKLVRHSQSAAVISNARAAFDAFSE